MFNLHLAIKKAASSTVTFITLPYLIAILVGGTIAQRYIGLYPALDQIFYAWVIWVGIIPIPGGLTAMTVFFINLLARFIGYSVWTRDRLGLHLAHFGVLLLLIGGMISGVTRVDTVIPLDINQSADFSQSYDHSTLHIYKDNQIIAAYPFDTFSKGQVLTPQDTDLNVEILDICQNCKIELRQDSTDNWQGLAAKMALTPAPLEVNPEQNLTGLSFKIEDKKHISFLFLPKPPKFNGYTFKVERSRTPLPFNITLKHFEIERHPGTHKASGYLSDVEITDTSGTQDIRISMNKPAHYKNYRLYQSSYIDNPTGAYTSILAISKNTGRVFPYFAGLILGLGLLLHCAIRYRQSVIKAIILLGLLFPTSAKAAVDYTSFGQLPILHEGRVKPLDQFARIYMHYFSESEAQAVEHLAEILFTPYTAIERPIFTIPTRNLAHKLGLNTEQDLYSYKDLNTGLEATKADFIAAIEKQESNTPLSKVEKDIITIHEKNLYYLQLLRSFSFAIPLRENISYKTLQRDSARLKDELNELRERKGDETASYTAEELDIVYKNYQLDLFTETGRNNITFRVIPSPNRDAHLIAPWQVLNTGQGSPQTQGFSQQWIALMTAYQNDDLDAWNKSLQTLHEKYAPITKSTELKIEYWYHTLGLSTLIIGLCFLTALLMFFYSLYPIKLLNISSSWVAGTTTLGLAGLLLFRGFILDRPPIGTLYETLIFVSFILCFTCYTLYRHKMKALIFTLGFGFAGFMLLLAETIHNQGDDLQLLEAVLNTNFWLSTHVVIITIGYGWCLLTAAIAHVELFSPQKALTHTKTLTLHTCIALLLTAVGTVLGGIWADQSWGRFWGWDPKENGALLIVLWLIWALHSKASGHFSDLLYRICLASLASIVMLSWFGVNLLNIGLHSYGFIQGVAEMLFGFIIFQTILLTIIYRKRQP